MKAYSGFFEMLRDEIIHAPQNENESDKDKVHDSQDQDPHAVRKDEYMELINNNRVLQEANNLLEQENEELRQKQNEHVLTIEAICKYAMELEDQTHRIFFHSMLLELCENPTKEESAMIRKLTKSQKKPRIIKANNYVENQNNGQNIERVEPGASGITITEPKQLKK